eukprot:CAMPEP_0183511382 /NCGR_PEP_ID=MMETSP0371-20130417/10860_1 /TAXON_ID=268820 /ORGANISM="Peridinium aciculiferum, Strain PAER-2" /LENGTH=77 /DNA_ID=CAMNT_0025708295 /DNA_START=42 /DNA_END=275 /DNA_ORIENTATION=-
MYECSILKVEFDERGNGLDEALESVLSLRDRTQLGVPRVPLSAPVGTRGLVITGSSDAAREALARRPREGMPSSCVA